MSSYKKRFKKKNLLFSASALCLATGLLQIPVHAEVLNQGTDLSASTTGSAIATQSTGTAAPPATNNAASGVQLIDQNSTSVVLQNSKVSIIVNKTTAQITSVKLVGSDHSNQDVNLVGAQKAAGMPHIIILLAIKAMPRGFRQQTIEWFPTHLTGSKLP